MQVKCLECNQTLPRISNTHLLKCCGLTMQEYSLKHNIPLDQLVSPSVCVQASLTLKERSKISKQLTLQEVRKTIENEKTIIPTKQEEQIILGSLLGDGYLFQGSKHPFSTYLVLEHGVRQLDYLIWKGRRLERFKAKFYQYLKYDSIKQRLGAINQVRTASYPLFGKLTRSFYTEKGKTILDKSFVEKLGPLGLAVWYMDNGSSNFYQCCLYTQSFDEKSIDILIDVLKENFNLNVIKHSDGNKCFLSFDKNNSAKLLKIIKPFVIPSMRYKLGNNTSTLTVYKEIPFDAAHFLLNYPGKCSNLHGGRWRLQVGCSGQINPDTGMVIDYTYLKKVVENHIISRLDHQCINYSIPELHWRSTTELICIWIWFTLLEVLPGLSIIRLYETPDSWTEYTGPSFNELKKNKTHPDLLLLKHFQVFNSFRSRLIGEIDEVFNEPLHDKLTLNIKEE